MEILPHKYLINELKIDKKKRKDYEKAKIKEKNQ